MRRLTASLVSVAALVALSLVLAGTAAAGAPAPIASKGSFTVCMDVSFAPMEYYATPGSTKPAGFDVDLVKAIAAYWKVKPVFLPTDFTGLLPALAAQKCDFVWSAMFVSPARTKQFPAVPYMRTHRAFLVRKGNPDKIGSPTTLSGKTVATQSGTLFVKQLQALDKTLKKQGNAGINIQTYPKASDATEQLLVGRASAVLTQDVEAAFRSTSMPGKFQIAYLFPQFDTFGAYYRKDSAEIGAGLKQALKVMKANGTLAKIAKKHGLPLKDFQF